MKYFLVTAISLSCLALGLGLHFGALALGYQNEEILIQSWESRTREDLPVYNRIRWFNLGTADVWMMNQSHHGVSPVAEKWDRLAIVVDRMSTPRRARFYQLPPGELKWNQELVSRAIEYRVSCFLCHPNGPRSIRPDPNAIMRLTWLEKLKLRAWNLRIKNYGRVLSEQPQSAKFSGRKVPFRMAGPLENSPLTVKSCARCHNENGQYARGALYRQNGIAIQSMIEKGLMPPAGHSIKPEDQKKIERFLDGF